MAASPRVSLEIHQAPGAGAWLIGSPASPSFDLDSTSFEPPNTPSTSPSSPGTRTASCAVLDHCCDHAVVCPCGKPQLATMRSHTFSLKRRRQGSTLRSKESSQLQPRPNRPADGWIPHGCRSWYPICAQAKKRNPAHKHNSSDKGNTHVPVTAMDYMHMNETTDDTNNPLLVIHDSCSEGIWAVFTKKKGGQRA